MKKLNKIKINEITGLVDGDGTLEDTATRCCQLIALARRSDDCRLRSTAREMLKRRGVRW